MAGAVGVFIQDDKKFFATPADQGIAIIFGQSLTENAAAVLFETGNKIPAPWS
jgi:hypothetical protein